MMMMNLHGRRMHHHRMLLLDDDDVVDNFVDYSKLVVHSYQYYY